MHDVQWPQACDQRCRMPSTNPRRRLAYTREMWGSHSGNLSRAHLPLLDVGKDARPDTLRCEFPHNSPKRRPWLAVHWSMPRNYGKNSRLSEVKKLTTRWRPRSAGGGAWQVQRAWRVCRGLVMVRAIAYELKIGMLRVYILRAVVALQDTLTLQGRCVVISCRDAQTTFANFQSISCRPSPIPP
jgi:hypothetical protein